MESAARRRPTKMAELPVTVNHRLGSVPDSTVMLAGRGAQP